MNAALEKLLLSELRIVVYEPAAAADLSGDLRVIESPALSDEQIAKAMTVNEELRNLGYTLKPQDILALAPSRSVNGFAEHFRSLLPSVDAPPMYPDFPKQVMEMDEAEFRMHQMIHYFSTYGLEDLFGVEIRRGWLPNVEATPKSESDQTLLKAKVLELLPEQAAPLKAVRRILARRERMSKPAREIVALAIPLLRPEELAGISIPFKENLVLLFDAILKGTDGPDRIRYLRQICQHTGDVMKCLRGILPKHGYHLRTGQKRAVVKLLETYPAADFKANLILSRAGREKNLRSLQYLDYNIYSRSEAHREAVRALRNGELRSWEAQARRLVESETWEALESGTGGALESKAGGALDFIAARPGMLLRMIRWLLRRGYKDSEILERLTEKADVLSMYTIVDTLNALEEAGEREPVGELFMEAMRWREETAEARREIYKERIRSAANDPDTDLELLGHKIRNKLHKEKKENEAFLRGFEKARALYEKSAPYDGRVCDILTAVLSEHLKRMRTVLFGKKVYLQMDAYDLPRSRLKGGKGSDEGGYLPAGIAIRIPDEIRRLRFFVYWNDADRVDLDLHATGYDTDFNKVHVGWNADFKKAGIVHSGDITHSNAAEYIDVDLGAPLLQARMQIVIYSGKPSFKKIDTCYVGMMAVKKLGAKVKLYDPKNCFFTHALQSDSSALHYGYINVPERRLYFVGKEMKELPEYYRPAGAGKRDPNSGNRLTLEKYLSMLFEAQEAEVVSSAEEADVILTMEKSAEKNAVSLVDNNFFLEK
ncbi:MAG: hypothetical protein IJ198_10655 [Lachnospiraceae bacterium]|nr:hypothetical protein [Lachnospiraceae bacterium]